MVRADRLSASMSRYLLRHIEENPNITRHMRTQLMAVEGSDRRERFGWRSACTYRAEMLDIRHGILMTGAVPDTDCLKGCVCPDQKGFVQINGRCRAPLT